MIKGNYTALQTPVRNIKAKVELYKGSTLVDTFTYEDAIKSIDIERVGNESKFFGFVVIQRANLHLRDIGRSLDISTANSFKVFFAAGEEDYICNYPTFYVSEVNRDENTNELSITAYDALEKAQKAMANVFNTNIADIEKIAIFLADEIEGIYSYSPLKVDNVIKYDDLDLDANVNLEGTETIYEVLSAIAEAIGAVMYLKPVERSEWNEEAANNIIINGSELVIKPIANAAVALTIDKANYIELNSKTNRKLTTICSATELGDNLSATTGAIGTTQYIRNNPFLDLREDRAAKVDALCALLGDLTVNQFDCIWRGNYFLEIGDKIELITKDGGSVFSYVFNDKINYTGSLTEATSWTYIEGDNEAANPTNLGEAIKLTFAKVDKIEKQIDIVASETDANKSSIAAIQLNTESINASVTKIEETVIQSLEETTAEIAEIKNTVDAQMTAEEVSLKIKEEIASGVDKVETATGFTFNEEGLTVNKTNSEMKTTITEDGMKVYKNNKEVLTADNVGVNAKNLHATTYLIIGNNSRFEDYGRNRTGCFWIGG